MSPVISNPGGEHQIFHWGRHAWDIDKAEAIIKARKKNKNPEPVEVDPLYESIRFNTVLGIRIDVEYATKQADVTEPIIFGLVKVGKEVFSILIDGHHRLYRAKHEGLKTLPSYALTPAENRKVMIR